MKIPLFALACALAVSSALAFTVTKNVNDGTLPKDKLVVFDKSMPADQVSTYDNESCKLTRLPDGSIESRIEGSGEVKFGFKLKEPINARDYGFVVLTCRIEGNNKMIGPNGKTTDQPRADNLWFGPTLFDAAGAPHGSANLADGSPDGKTPDKTVDVILPMLLFTYWGDQDVNKIQALGFTWAKTRPNLSRDYHFVIDKISFAN